MSIGYWRHHLRPLLDPTAQGPNHICSLDFRIIFEYIHAGCLWYILLLVVIVTILKQCLGSHKKWIFKDRGISVYHVVLWPQITIETINREIMSIGYWRHHFWPLLDPTAQGPNHICSFDFHIIFEDMHDGCLWYILLLVVVVTILKQCLGSNKKWRS